MPSSVIQYFSYDQQKGTLKIAFVSGTVYFYKNVPKEIYDALKIAGSKGRYFHFFIRDKYEFDKVDEP